MAIQRDLARPAQKVEALITGEELAELDDPGRSELVEGKIVELSPTKMQHGRYEFEIARSLGNFAEKHNLGVVMVGEVGIYTHRNPDTIRGADVLFISHEFPPPLAHRQT